MRHSDEWASKRKLEKWELQFDIKNASLPQQSSWVTARLQEISE